MLSNSYTPSQGRCHSWTCNPLPYSTTHTCIHIKERQTSVRMLPHAQAEFFFPLCFLNPSCPVALFFSHLYTHAHTNIHIVTKLTCQLQSDHEQKDSLIGLGGARSEDKGSARSGRLKMHFHFGRDVSFLISAPLCQHLFASGSNFHYHWEQRGVRDFVVLMERNVTSIMHFLLEDATHGHTWPCVRERWTGRG